MPHPQQLNYSHLRYFWAVAHAGNLTRAAEQLHVSQSSISVQIQKLERDLGQALFERRGKQLILTEAGHIALDHADAIFAIGEELVGTLHLRGDHQRHALRIGAQATLSRNFQLGFVEPLIDRDDVDLMIRSGALNDLLRHLEAHRLDVVLSNYLPMRDTATNWVAHVLAEQAVSLVGHPDRATDWQDLAQGLAQTPLVLPGTTSSIRSGFDALVERLNVQTIIAAEIDDMAMLRLIARAHQGAAVVPSIVVKDELDSGELVQLAELKDLTETFYAITLTRRFPNPLLRELIAGDPLHS